MVGEITKIVNFALVVNGGFGDESSEISDSYHLFSDIFLFVGSFSINFRWKFMWWVKT